MSREEADQLHAEWRENVMKELSDIKAMLTGKEERIRALENNQSRAIGFLVAVQALGAFAIWLMNRAFGQHP